eukprot:12889130-Prorocentrum_lima.AAC.1
MADNQDNSQLLLGRASMLQRTLRGERVSSEERRRGQRASAASPTAAARGISTSSRAATGYEPKFC